MKSLAAIPKMLMSLIVLGLIIVGAFLFMIKGLELLANLDALKYQQTALAIARMISKDPRITNEPFVINSTKCKELSSQIGQEINNMFSGSNLRVYFIVAKEIQKTLPERDVVCEGGNKGWPKIIVVKAPTFIENDMGYLKVILWRS